MKKNANSADKKIITVFAPVKINLYLHVTGRKDDGYHLLDSMVSFADIGDSIIIEPASDFEFHIKGPYAKNFNPKDRDHSPNSSNLAVRAAWGLAHIAQKNLSLKITLTKNVPLASGLGGGSSDAGSVLWGLCEYWGITPKTLNLHGLMLELGADVPACFECRPLRVQGIGEILKPAPSMNEVPVVIINPGKLCSTPKVFMGFHGPYKQPIHIPESLENFEALIDFLKNQANQLEEPARDIVPEIGNVLNALHAQDGCKLARMSGSGASCFGLFETLNQANQAVVEISKDNPDWWTRSGWLNRPERY